MQDPTARRVAGYELGAELGRGGMGVVFAARQATLDRPAVLKRLRRELVDEPEVVERFLNEARTAASVHHPNVAAVYDCFRHRSEWYIAQEYVDGIDLRQLLDRKERIPPRTAARIALEIARGLEALHHRGTVHRDLKPGNVLIGREGQVKLVDFGIALGATREALTRPGTALGTPPYMSPEQLNGERADARSDLFALGVVMYEMLTGSLPYAVPEEGEWASLLTAMRKERYPRLHRRTPAQEGARGARLPRELRRVVQSCLRAKPSRRAASAQAVRRKLADLVAAPAEDVRADIALWAWDAGVFERREAETLVIAAPPAERQPHRLRWAAAAASVAFAAASAWWLGQGWVGDLPQLLAQVPN